MKSERLSAFPFGVVSEIFPVVAPLGTKAQTCVSSCTTIELAAAATPLNLTEVVPVSLDPKIATRVPTRPEVGVKLVIVGAARATVIVSVAEPVPVALVAESETGNVPEAVGVPVIAPVEVSILKPAGNPVALKLVGELFAVTL